MTAPAEPRPSRRGVLAGAVGLAAGLSAAPAAWAGPPGPGTLAAADVHVQDFPTVRAIEWIGARLAEATNGRLSVRMYHSGQIGRENDTLDLTRYGALALTRVNCAALTNILPVTGVLTLPYIFDAVPHMRRVVDGAVGRAVLADASRRGLVALCIYDSGVRCLYNARRPVLEPGDLRGMKIRVPLSDVFMDMLKAMGANPTPLSYGEVFTALQTKLIDGAENNWPSLDSSRQFEVAHHWSETRHSLSPEVLFISRQRLEALSGPDRALFTDIAAASVAYMRDLWDREETAARAHCLAQGVTIAETDREAFRRATAPVVAAYCRDPAMDALYRQIRAEA